MGAWAFIVFSDLANRFDLSNVIKKNDFFVRKMTIPSATIIFAQSTKLEKIYPRKFEALIRDCGWEKEAEMIASSDAKLSETIKIELQQSVTFSSEKKSAILVGDAAAAASFFQGMGANTALKTASIAGDFFKKKMKTDNDAYFFFNQNMKEITDLMIEDSKFLFLSN